MKILAIETATEACSAALLIDGEVRERFRVAPREHASLILAMCDELLREAGIGLPSLDAVAVGRGPGSFTGVRIAVGVAQGIGFGADLPVIPVSTLATVAQGAYRERGWREIVVAMDARMGEVYWGEFQVTEGELTLRGEERLSPPAQVVLPEGGEWSGCGTGWAAYPELGARWPAGRVDDSRLPRARDTAWLGAAGLRRGEGVKAEDLVPTYLRDQVAHKRES